MEEKSRKKRKNIDQSQPTVTIKHTSIQYLNKTTTIRVENFSVQVIKCFTEIKRQENTKDLKNRHHTMKAFFFLYKRS